MVEKAPSIAAVLPSFLEFLGNSVIVGHNVQFDLGFLNAALDEGLTTPNQVTKLSTR